MKTSTEPGGALQRAKIAFFVDTWFTKIHSSYFPVLRTKGAEKEEAAAKVVDAITKEIEPLLKDASPFFGGSEKLTFAEVFTISFSFLLYGWRVIDKLN